MFYNLLYDTEQSKQFVKETICSQRGQQPVRWSWRLLTLCLKESTKCTKCSLNNSLVHLTLNAFTIITIRKRNRIEPLRPRDPSSPRYTFITSQNVLQNCTFQVLIFLSFASKESLRLGTGFNYLVNSESKTQSSRCLRLAEEVETI